MKTPNSSLFSLSLLFGQVGNRLKIYTRDKNLEQLLDITLLNSGICYLNKINDKNAVRLPSCQCVLL